MNKLPKSLFISHGGGPLPLLGDAAHGEMILCLQKIAKETPKPDAIVVVSAHWEASVAAIVKGSDPFTTKLFRRETLRFLAPYNWIPASAGMTINKQNKVRSP